MGKGDKKTKKGKISMGSYGVSRPKPSKLKKHVPEAVEKAEKAEKKAPAKKAAANSTKKATAKKKS